MRRTVFGDLVIESEDDDLGMALAEFEEDVLAILREDETESPGNWYFEILSDSDGEAVVTSDSIFPSKGAAREYLRIWIEDIQS